MLRVGLTGGVACGKTTVGQMFAARGAHLANADNIARDLMQPGDAVYQQVVEHFGTEILNRDGSIDRQRLADAAFGTGRIEELNRIVHPAVVARQDAWADEIGRRDPMGIAVVEAALLLEAGAGPRFNKLIVVVCTPEQKVERFASRMNVSREAAQAEVARRMAAQLADEEKVKEADYVIDNSGTLADTEKQVDKIFAELRELTQ